MKEDDPTLSALESPADSLAAEPAFDGGRIVGDRYRIDARLGKGGMGEVWQAFDLSLQVDVALKTLALPAQPSAGDAYRRQMPRREVRAARQVNSPNVCRIFDLIVADGHELVSMEYIDGETLTQKLRSGSALEPHEVADIASQLLAGLEAIHGVGLVHRDIKPDNVMVTRSGRVVVMDFGLALPALEGQTVVGTPAYMPPEQLRGGAVDARSDVFAAGVLLAELISQSEICDRASREGLWSSVRQSPPVLPESPWREVLARAVDADPEKRYASARALAQALEEVTLRTGQAEDRTPYPGLSTFTKDDAEYFFGREAEVEAVTKRLGHPRLQAIIGPSGTGKSSFLRAGLVPALGSQWGCVLCHPGSAPMQALGQALAPEMAGDTQAVRDLVRFDQPEIALSVLGRWQERHVRCLIIVDQFEELFTLNAEEVQAQFAEFLSRATLEAGVVVLLSMRDDFLYHCQGQPALQPIFADLVPIGALGKEALRRALVQPALLCGYRFEEGLADEMVAEVTEERGALPLLAFAAQQLWERRNHEQGLLSRRAYEEIGGVGGALAQHAEATLNQIGSERQPIVRELFRNLVTAEGTRASRSVEELMSLFDHDQENQREVLSDLIDARLLTEYEVAAPGGGEDEGVQRVEIIHESLLSAWPRLVRWRSQDADGARLRDQLRQAAQLWQARDRADDLLWSGASCRELQLWRERYPGALTAVEESFAVATVRRAGKLQRLRQLTVTAAFLALLLVVGVVAVLWRGSEAAGLRSEAARLLALGRLELSRNPTAAVAYALESLDLSDQMETRRFILEALWRGPTAFVPAVSSDSSLWQLDFSPDGRWIAGLREDGSLDLWESHGDPPLRVTVSQPGLGLLRFGPRSELIMVSLQGSSSIRFWSVPDGELRRTLEVPGLRTWTLSSNRELLLTAAQNDRWLKVESRPIRGGEPTLLGLLEEEAGSLLKIDPTGSRLALADSDSGSLRLISIGGEPQDEAGGPLRHQDRIVDIAFSADGKRAATGDRTGEVRLWSLDQHVDSPLRTWRADGGRIRNLTFDPSGRLLAAATGTTARVWDLEAPVEADPVLLDLNQTQMNFAAFHPSEPWLATAGSNGRLILWPFGRKYARVLRGHAGDTYGVGFSPDGRWVASTSADGTLRIWPLAAEEHQASRVVHRSPVVLHDLDISADGSWLLLGANIPRQSREVGEVGVLLVSASGERTQVLEGFGSSAWYVALSPDGRLAAAAAGQWVAEEGVIRIWNLETGEVQLLDPGEHRWIAHLHFTPDGRLVSGGCCSVRIWSLEDGTFETVRQGPPGENNLLFAVATSEDGELLVSGTYDFTPTETLAEALPLLVQNLLSGDSWEITSHGDPTFLGDLAIDRAKQTLVSASWLGPVRAGPITGQEPHLLLGHESFALAVAISPDSQWIASVGQDSTLRLWPMPEGRPFHTLESSDLLERLRSLTNLRAVRDPEADGGYRIAPGRFKGWTSVPTW